MSFAPGWRGTNVIMQEHDERINRGTADIPNINFMSVRAKFRCDKVEPYSYDNGQTIAGKNISLSAVIAYGADGVRHDENESWSAATPSGQISIHISNPAAFEQFEEGKHYYIDFTPAEG